MKIEKIYLYVDRYVSTADRRDTNCHVLSVDIIAWWRQAVSSWNFATNMRVSMGLSVWRETSKKLTVCREKGKKLTVCRELFLFR